MSELKKKNNLFTKHPHAIGESYWGHMWTALYFGFHFLLGSIVCIIHSIFPFLFENTASNITNKLYEKMKNRKK